MYIINRLQTADCCTYPSRLIISLSSSFPMWTLRRERIWPKEDKSAMVSANEDWLMVYALHRGPSIWPLTP